MHGMLESDVSRLAFDTRTSAGIASPSLACQASIHDVIRDVDFDDLIRGDRPYALNVNRSDLLFYGGKPGLKKISRGKGRGAFLKEHCTDVNENTAGEWTLRVEDSETASRVAQLVLGFSAQEPTLAPRHRWVNHKQSHRQEMYGGVPLLA